MMQSSKDAPGHTKLKYRRGAQAMDADGDALRAALEEKERAHLKDKNKFNFEEEKARDLELLEATPAAEGPRLVPKAADADDADDSDSEGSSADSDDEDEEEALLAELEKIKREREAEREKAAEAARAQEEAEKREQAAAGNPLMAGMGGGAGGAGDGALKRKWYEDTVFRNQARGEPKQQKRFINDTVRSDFHKKFLERYLR